MRAVEQIIRYLHEHGSLTRDQLAHLERLGLWHRSAEEVAADPEPVEILEPEPWEIEVERTEERGRKKGKRGRSGDRPNDVTAEELNAHIAEQFDGWRPGLEGLVTLGRRLAGPGGMGAAGPRPGGLPQLGEGPGVGPKHPSGTRRAGGGGAPAQAAATAQGARDAPVNEDYRDLPKGWKASMDAVGAYR